MTDIFLSYASADRERARVLAEALTRNGYRVWWDRTIPPGRMFDEVIQEALQAAQCIVVLWSAEAVRSNWVKTEAGEALAQGKLVPTLIESVLPPIEFKRIQAADLSGWSGDETDTEYRKLLAAIEDRLQRAGQPAAGSAPSARAQPSSAAPVRTSGLPILVLMGIVGALGLASALALHWFARDNSAPAPATPSVQSAKIDAAPQSSAAPAARSARPAVQGEPAAAAATPGRVNLLATENGGELITASNERWAMTIDGKEDTYAWIDNGEGVYGFKDGRTATFDTFAVLIPNTSDSNLREFELLAGNERDARFQSIGRFTTQNLRIMKNPYQEFRFAPVHAKYLKFRSLTSHAGSTTVTGYEFRLYGTLD